MFRLETVIERRKIERMEVVRSGNLAMNLDRARPMKRGPFCRRGRCAPFLFWLFGF
jgi:hypothetical protein